MLVNNRMALQRPMENVLKLYLILLLVLIKQNNVTCQVLKSDFYSSIEKVNYNIFSSELSCFRNMYENNCNKSKLVTAQLNIPNVKLKDTQSRIQRSQFLWINKHTIGYSTLNNSSMFYGVTFSYENSEPWKSINFSKEDFFKTIFLTNDIGGELIFSNHSKVNFSIYNSFNLSFSTKYTDALFLPILGTNIHYSPFLGKNEFNIIPIVGVTASTFLDLTYGYSINRTQLFEGYNKHNISLKFRIGVFLSAFENFPKNYLIRNYFFFAIFENSDN